MKKKHLIYACYAISVIIAIFASWNIVSLLSLLKENANEITKEFITLFSITSGVILIGFSMASLISNVRKGLVFIRRNQKILLYYGIAITVLSIIAYIGTPLYSESLASIAANLLSIFGIFLLFFAIIFKIGIEMQEEQNLTI
ncbi:MAG: DUF2975 domain-containing protein [Bacteroidia bacterium]|nr:DUF2975 domain-containing protein [Bacteroidia bacterium]